MKKVTKIEDVVLGRIYTWRCADCAYAVDAEQNPCGNTFTFETPASLVFNEKYDDVQCGSYLIPLERGKDRYLKMLTLDQEPKMIMMSVFTGWIPVLYLHEEEEDQPTAKP